MTDRMKAFDKCIDQLIDAVTCDMIHADNLTDDLSKALQMRLTRDKKKKLEEIREETLAEFRKDVKEEIEQNLKDNLKLQECFEDFDNKQQHAKKPWRINGDPQHDTYAQRQPIYKEHIKKLDQYIDELEQERNELMASLN